MLLPVSSSVVMVAIRTTPCPTRAAFGKDDRLTRGAETLFGVLKAERNLLLRKQTQRHAFLSKLLVLRWILAGDLRS
jgi:hypothetical protein